jgi:hypothetical protein
MECITYVCVCIYLFIYYVHILLDLCNTKVLVWLVFAVTVLVYLQIKEISFTLQNLSVFHVNGKWFHAFRLIVSNS